MPARAHRPAHLPQTPRATRWGCYGALVGTSALIIADVAALIVNDANPVQQTISALTWGPHAWIQTTGLDFYALGIAALATGLFFWHRTTRRGWLTGLTLLFGAGVIVFFIAAQTHEPHSYRAVPHRLLVIVLFVTLVLALALMARELWSLHRIASRWSLATSVALLCLGTPYFFAPESIEGAYERALVLLMLAWTTEIALIALRSRRFVEHAPP